MPAFFARSTKLFAAIGEMLFVQILDGPQWLLFNSLHLSIHLALLTEDELRLKFSTVKRNDVQKETVAVLKKHLQYEYDFYYFVKARFYDSISKMRNPLHFSSKAETTML